MSASRNRLRDYFRIISGIGLLLALFIFTEDGYAAPAEKPVNPGTLTDIRRTLADEERKTAELARKVTQARGTLEQAREKLVDMGTKVRESEARLHDIDARIADLTVQETALRTRLEGDEGALSDLVLALARLRRVPPESALLRPGVPLDQARSALILHGILPDVKRRADSLRIDLDNMARILRDLETNRALAAAENARLQTGYAGLNALMTERESLYGQTRQAHADQTRTVARISERARTLSDLVARLAREEAARRKREEEEQRRIASAKKQPSSKADTPLPAAGVARLPVSGTLAVRYGEKNEMGARSEGLTLQGRAGSVVVAPMGGVIRYAGAFRRFGNIVIIEHQKGLHSLLAGLGKIDTVVGRSVSAGEPVGFLSVPADSAPPRLYYELRRNGQPMDPSSRLAGLG